MKVVILSDTHIKGRNKIFPDTFLKELSDTDCIIHAGDWSDIGVYEDLKVYAPVFGVHGNAEEDEVQHTFPDKKILTLHGYKIGIVHGHGEGKTTDRRAFDAFSDDHVDIIIFGHSHISMLRYFKKRLLVNPGSITQKRTNPCYSFAVLQLGNSLDVRHIFFS